MSKERREWQPPAGYWEYHERVIAAVRANLLKRHGHPTTFAERHVLNRANEAAG